MKIYSMIVGKRQPKFESGNSQNEGTTVRLTWSQLGEFDSFNIIPMANGSTLPTITNITSLTYDYTWNSRWAYKFVIQGIRKSQVVDSLTLYASMLLTHTPRVFVNSSSGSVEIGHTIVNGYLKVDNYQAPSSSSTVTLWFDTPIDTTTWNKIRFNHGFDRTGSNHLYQWKIHSPAYNIHDNYNAFTRATSHDTDDGIRPFIDSTIQNLNVTGNHKLVLTGVPAYTKITRFFYVAMYN